MADPTLRVLQLLSLLQEHAVWTGPQLAQRLGVSVRGVRRDVDKLRELGYPVRSERGSGGGYRLAAGAAMPPLVLDDDEAVAVAVSLAVAAGGTVEGVGEASVRALAKLDQVVPTRLRERIAGLTESTVRLEAGVAPVDAALLTGLAGACRDHVQVRVAYRKVPRAGSADQEHRRREGLDRPAGSRDGVGRGAARDTRATAAGSPVAEAGESTDRPATGVSADAEAQRRLEPYRLVAAGRRWYLLAFDLDRDDWRVFRLDRMRDLHVTTFRFAPREAPDAAERVARGTSFEAYRYRAVLHVDAPLAQVREVLPPTVVHAEEMPGDPTRCILRTGADDPRLVAAWVGTLPWTMHVVEPEEVREAFVALARRLHEAAR